MVHVHQIHVFCRQAHGLSIGNSVILGRTGKQANHGGTLHGVGTADQIGAVVVAGLDDVAVRPGIHGLAAGVDGGIKHIGETAGTQNVHAGHARAGNIQLTGSHSLVNGGAGGQSNDLHIQASVFKQTHVTGIVQIQAGLADLTAHFQMNSGQVAAVCRAAGSRGISGRCSIARAAAGCKADREGQGKSKRQCLFQR